MPDRAARRATRVAAIDYGAGNLRSVSQALRRASRDVAGDWEIEIVSDADRVAKADRIVLPGVGAFGWCRSALSRCEGMMEALEAAIRERGAPFLGICVGMQLMMGVGREDGEHRGLGWIAGESAALPSDLGLRLPHMGWNALRVVRRHPVFAAAEKGGLHVYFAHSYAVRPEDRETVAMTCDYGVSFPAALACDNMVGTQFHPEKSQAAGLSVLSAFLGWRP